MNEAICPKCRKPIREHSGAMGSTVTKPRISPGPTVGPSWDERPMMPVSPGDLDTRNYAHIWMNWIGVVAAHMDKAMLTSEDALMRLRKMGHGPYEVLRGSYQFKTHYPHATEHDMRLLSVSPSGPIIADIVDAIYA